MKYPIPLDKELYNYIDEINKDNFSYGDYKDNKKKDSFSRENHNEYIGDYIEYIKKRKRLYGSLPFIRQIYLCNSITFNALHKDSDIDICIITQEGYIRRARFRSVLLFRSIRIKRIQGVKTRSFCLSFYIDEKHTDIYHLRHNDGDVYLPYRLAHCVLLYTDNKLSNDYLRKNNKALLSFLPNHPLYQTINIGSPIYNDSTWFKIIIEGILKNKVGKFLQKILQYIWKPVLYYKKSKFKKYIQQEIIISNSILKFHNDKRHFFQFRKKNNNSKGVTLG